MAIGLAGSDLLLALASALAAWRVRAVCGAGPAVAGFAVLGAAALVGAARYAALPSWAAAHAVASALGGQVGLPLIGIGFLRARSAGPWRRPFAPPASGAVLLAVAALARALALADAWAGVIGAASLVAIDAAALAKPADRTARAAALGATGAYLLGTLAAVLGGAHGGIVAFHLALATANVALAVALRALPGSPGDEGSDRGGGSEGRPAREAGPTRAPPPALWPRSSAP